jgi:hypothetical protein
LPSLALRASVDRIFIFLLQTVKSFIKKGDHL